MTTTTVEQTLRLARPERPADYPPTIVRATEPVPGLRVVNIPDDNLPWSPYRWVVVHHTGVLVASAWDEPIATATAVALAPVTDWTGDVKTIRAAITDTYPDSWSGVAALIYDAGGRPSGD